MYRERGEVVLQTARFFHPNGDFVEYRLWSGGEVDMRHVPWRQQHDQGSCYFHPISLDSLPQINWTAGNVQCCGVTVNLRANPVDISTLHYNEGTRGTILVLHKEESTTTREIFAY